MEGRGARVPLAPSERKSPSCKITWRFLAACTQGSHADAAREVFFLKKLHQRRGHLGTPRLLTVGSIQFSPVLATWVMRSTIRACRHNDVSHRSNCPVIGDAGSLSPPWGEVHLSLEGTTSWRNPERVRQTRWVSRRVSRLEEECGTLTFEASLYSTGEDDFLARLQVQGESLGNLHDRSLFPPGSRSFPARFPPPDQGLPVVVAPSCATLVLY
jgi:hypothetical protein